MYQIVLSANTPRGEFQGVFPTDFISPSDASAFLKDFKSKLHQRGFVTIQAERPAPTSRFAKLDSDVNSGGNGEGGEIVLPFELLLQSVLSFSIRQIRR